MSAVAIVDTSVFCSVLDIPHMNVERDQAIAELTQYLKSQTTLLLPMATVYETGNHIAKLANGGNRRRFAQLFVKQVEQAMTGVAPWQVMQVSTTEEFGKWLTGFPDAAMRRKGIGDLSIIKEWENFKRKIPDRRVFIWSLDSDLQGYDHRP